MSDAAMKPCRAKRHGQRCELPRGHRGFHRVAISETSRVEWASLDRVAAEWLRDKVKA